MMTNLQDMTCGLFMAQTSDELCRRKGVTREEIDTFAALSHSRTTASIDNDVFADEIVPVTIKSRRGETVLTHKDEDHVVRGTTQASLSGLPDGLWPGIFRDGRQCLGCGGRRCCRCHQVGCTSRS